MSEPADWSRVDALLEEALGRPRAERARFLDEACAGDAPLRARLDALLAIAEADDPELRPGGGLTGALAREVLDDLERRPLPPPPATGPTLAERLRRGALPWR